MEPSQMWNYRLYPLIAFTVSLLLILNACNNETDPDNTIQFTIDPNELNQVLAITGGTSNNGELNTIPVKKLLAANVPSLMLITDPNPMSFLDQHTTGVIPQFRTPSTFEVDDLIDSIERMGINFIRLYPPSITGGAFSDNHLITDTGHILSYDKNKTTTISSGIYKGIYYDKVKFDRLNSILSKLNNKNIQVAIPIIDNWCFWGGIQDFVDMIDKSYGKTPSKGSVNKTHCYPSGTNNNIPDNKGSANLDQKKISLFYTNNRYISVYKNYFEMLNALLGHHNNILWETGNELGQRVRYNHNIPFNKTETNAFSKAECDRLVELNSWSKNVAKFIKQVSSGSPKPLLIDGSYGVNLGVNQPCIGTKGQINITSGNLDDPNIDIVSNHYYQLGYMDTLYHYDTKKISQYHTQKPYFVGEFMCGLDCNEAFFKAFTPIQHNFSTFASFWSLSGNADKGMHLNKQTHKEVMIPNNYATGAYLHHEMNGFSSYHFPGSDAKNSDQDFNSTKYQVVKRFVEVAVSLSKKQKKGPLNTPAAKVVTVQNQQRLVWPGVAGAYKYCIYKNTKFWQEVHFIFGDNTLFSGQIIHNYLPSDDYKVKPYEYGKTCPTKL